MALEANKEMLARIIRYGLLFVSGFLVTRGAIPQDFAEVWLNETTTLIAGLVIVTIPIVWGWLKARFDEKTIVAAVKLPQVADTPLEVKAAVEEAKNIAAYGGAS